jgi:hypothetical protein
MKDNSLIQLKFDEQFITDPWNVADALANQTNIPSSSVSSDTSYSTHNTLSVA